MNEKENNFIINTDIGEGSLRRRARGYLKLRNCQVSRRTRGRCIVSC